MSLRERIRHRPIKKWRQDVKTPGSEGSEPGTLGKIEGATWPARQRDEGRVY